jgi:hypothetical protein
MVGDLVCVKSWNMDSADGGWISIPADFGIIIEIVEVEHHYVFIDKKIRCYDYIIYWAKEEKVETLPDIIIEKFSDWTRRQNER